MRVRYLLLSAAMTAATLPAIAADYNPPIIVEQATPWVPVEVGSGWYLRGDINFDFDRPYKHYLTPEGFSESNYAVTGSVGMGYHINDFLRTELNFGLLSVNRFAREDALLGPFTGTCGGTQTVELVDSDVPANNSTTVSAVSVPCQRSDTGQNRSLNVMANAYVDLGTYSGFTPYVGGGIGVAHSQYKYVEGSRTCVGGDIVTVDGTQTTTTTFICDGATDTGAVAQGGTTDRKRSFDLAYSLGAGVAYQMTRNTQLDVGYQYMAVPNGLYVASEGGTNVIREGLKYHSLKVGLRYDLW
jgi:opacity protein-like surface antigen